jgi:hypothetical protein
MSNVRSSYASGINSKPTTEEGSSVNRLYKTVVVDIQRKNEKIKR